MPEKIEVTIKWTYTPYNHNHPVGSSLQEILETDIEGLQEDFISYPEDFINRLPDDVEITGKIISY